MSNKFVSFLKQVGHDIEWFLSKALPYAATMGQIAVDTYLPALGPAYRATVNAVITAEASAQKIKAAGGTVTGPQKLAMVLQLVGPIVSQALKDAGKDSSDAAVQAYINSVVLILDTAPALPAPTV